MLYVNGQHKKLRIRRVCNAKLVTGLLWTTSTSHTPKKKGFSLHKVATNFCVTCVAHFNRNYSHVGTLANVTGKQGSEVDSSTHRQHTRPASQHVEVWRSRTFLIELFHLGKKSPVGCSASFCVPFTSFDKQVHYLQQLLRKCGVDFEVNFRRLRSLLINYLGLMCGLVKWPVNVASRNEM